MTAFEFTPCHGDDEDSHTRNSGLGSRESMKFGPWRWRDGVGAMVLTRWRWRDGVGAMSLARWRDGVETTARDLPFLKNFLISIKKSQGVMIMAINF